MKKQIHSHRASIAIFKNSFEYEEAIGQPHVPAIIFETAKKVMETKGCELVKTRDGLYIVKYSPTGPFPNQVGNEWLPVYIARVERWSSGGIKRFEMNEFDGIVETFAESNNEQTVIDGDVIS